MADFSILEDGPLGDPKGWDESIYRRWETLGICVRDIGRWTALHDWIYGERCPPTADRDRLWHAAQSVAFVYAEAKADREEHLRVHQPALDKQVKKWRKLTNQARKHLHELEVLLGDKVFDDGRNLSKKRLAPLYQYLELLELQCPDWMKNQLRVGRQPLEDSANILFLTLAEIWKLYSGSRVSGDEKISFIALVLHAVDREKSLDAAEAYAADGFRKALKTARTKVPLQDLPNSGTGFIGKRL